MSSNKSRAIRVASWVGGSAGVAALGVLAAGGSEAAFASDGSEAIGTIGYAALLAWPALTAVVMIARGLWAAWRPAQLAAELVDEHGSAPRLAGWIGYLVAASFVLSWATFNTIRLLAAWTTFKPTVIALAVPPAATITALLLATASRPTVDGIAAVVRRIDRWCRARWKRSPFTPRILIATALVLFAGLAAFGWFVSVSPRIGYLDLHILLYPAIAIAVAVIAQVGARRLPRRVVRIGLAATAAIVIGAIGFALWLRSARPLAVLQVWARPTIASEVIEQLYYLEDLREDISVLVAPPPRRPGAVPRDIVLITIDTVRADHTPVGGGAAVMPNLARLGASGAVFTAAFSPGNVTRRSIPSIATGVAPPRVRGKVAGWALRLDPRHVLLAERFRAAGYDTAGFFCCLSFWGPQHRLGINRGLDHLVIEPNGALLADQARAWLIARRATSTKPLFIWVHFIEPHNWLEGRNDLKTAADRRAQYDKVLGEVDGYVGVLLDGFSGAGDRAPIVAISADHGEALGDHGQAYHSSDLYDSQIHVPLVIAGPGIPPHRVNEPVGVLGIAATLIDLAGFVPPGMPQMDGASFAALATGTGPGDASAGYAFSTMLRDRSVSDGMRAVIRGPWKLIETRRGFELYDRINDPGELKNLATTRLDKLAAMKTLLEARRTIDTVSPFGSP